MKNTRNILSSLEDNHKALTYYYSILEIIEQNVDKNPDICIESCKSLMEGLSKFILENLDKSYDRLSLDRLSFQALFKKSISELAKRSQELEEDFINRANSLIHLIGEIRNRRGDISHGRLAPKEEQSETSFSGLVMQMTDAIVFYWLLCFSRINMQIPIKYEDNMDFNLYLDELYPLNGLSYSKALFDQDKTTYEEELSNFIDSEN